MKPCIRKTIIVSLVLIALILLGIMIFVFVYLGIKTRVLGISVTREKWEIWYFIFSIIGSTGTVAAVILALFKEEILLKLNAPELVIKPFEDVFLITKKSAQGEILYYEYCLKIENKGSKTATDVSVSYDDLRYDIKRLRRAFDVVDVVGVEALVDNSSIPAGETICVPLFKVPNPNSAKSPEGNKVEASINFSNMQVEEKATYGAVFQIKYKIRANNNKELFASCDINWSGAWDDDNEKMLENITVKSL